MSKPWFRFHVRTLESPKVQKLSDANFKAWVNLLCLARQSTARGFLPPVADIAFKLRISEKDAARRVHDLIQAGLLDRKDGGVIPHDWEEMQYESDVSTNRVRAFRERHGNVSETVSPTFRERFPSESVSVSESESGKLVSSGQGSKKLVLGEQGRGVLQ